MLRLARFLDSVQNNNVEFITNGDKFYYKFNNGMMLAYGNQSQSANTRFTITFDVPFINDDYTFIITPRSELNVLDEYTTYTAKHTDRVECITAGSDVKIVNWFAIGLYKNFEPTEQKKLKDFKHIKISSGNLRRKEGRKYA